MRDAARPGGRLSTVTLPGRSGTQPVLATASSIPEVAFAGRPLDRTAIVPAGQPEPGRNKPSGALWLSPICRDPLGRITGTEWTRWCHHNWRANPAARPDAMLTPVRLTPDARVAVVAGPEDFASLAKAAGTCATRESGLTGPVELNWAGVASIADAFWLTADGLFSLGGWGEPFYWWDTQTVVALSARALCLSAQQRQRLGELADDRPRRGRTLHPASTRAGHGRECAELGQ